jgi:hypothetical protein
VPLSQFDCGPPAIFHAVHLGKILNCMCNGPPSPFFWYKYSFRTKICCAIMSAQPLHPSIIPRLDPEYVDFHNKHLAQIVPPHTYPWNPVTRNAVTMPGTSDPLPVGNTKDITLNKCEIRIFTPPGSPPAQGFPVFLFFHGGAFARDIIPTSYNSKLQVDGHTAISAAKIRSRHICALVRRFLMRTNFLLIARVQVLHVW